MALYKQTLAAFAVATLCCTLIASAAPANGKTNSKTSASNNSPFAAIRQQQQIAAAALKASTKTAQAPFSQQQQQQEPENDADGSQQQQQQQVQQQQVQQQQEVDPSAAAQDSQPALIAPAAIAAPSAAEPEEANPRPEPYAFSYSWASGDATSAGASSRNEQQDAAGTVTGFYTLQGEDGRDRRVDYIADAAGFRATVRTNELGTEAKDPADVRMLASAPTDGQLRTAAAATELARQRAVLVPQQNLAQTPIFAIGAQSNQGPLESASSANSQQQQQVSLPLASGNQASLALPPNSDQASKGGRKNPPRERFASGTKQTPVLAESQPSSQISQQLQEPFEQIRQSELKARSVRQAPFYLISV